MLKVGGTTGLILKLESAYICRNVSFSGTGFIYFALSGKASL